MATITGNFVSDNSSLANFKSWSQAISGAFSTLGWVQTADTGQVNWSTIVAVPSSTFVYEVWKANDSLAATMPIFVKVQYGFSATSPRLQVTVGTGSDGAGNITGQVISSAPWAITQLNVNEGSTTFPCFFSGTAGEFRMWMWGQPSATPAIGVLLIIERSKDASGNNTANYVTVLSTNQSTASAGTFQQSFTASGVGNRDVGAIVPALTNGSGTGLSFGTVAAFPCFPVIGLCGNPMLGFMTAAINDAAINSTVTVSSMYGSTHTYVAAGGNAINNFCGARQLNSATMVGLMRYE